jgi:hypothetical protein
MVRNMQHFLNKTNVNNWIGLFWYICCVDDQNIINHDTQPEAKIKLFGGLLGLSRCELFLSEVGSWGREISGSQRKGNVRRCKPLPSNGSKDATVDTSECECECVCVCINVNCKVQSYAVSNRGINRVISPRSVSTINLSLDNWCQKWEWIFVSIGMNCWA